MVTLKFSLYVFVRAVWLCDRDKLSERMLDQVLHLPETLQEKRLERQMTGHPWEIIYKYLALIAARENEAELAAEYMEKSRLPGEEKEGAIEAVIQNGLLEYAEYTGDLSEAEKERRSLDSMNRKPAQFTFMYH